VAEARQVFPDAEYQLLPSSGGVFDVTLDGELIFSKKAKGRHAAPGEVLELLRAKVKR
jgi:selenoprotein W-related protein